MFITLGSRGTRKRVGQDAWFISRRNNAAPNTATPVHSWTPFFPTSIDLDHRIGTKGTGAILSGVSDPDSTTIGGNKRGLRSIDLQIGGRNNANQVPSDNDTYIFGGRRGSIRNTGGSPASYSALVGGDGNYIASSSGTTGNATFLGGGVGVTVDMSGNSNARAYIGGNTVTFVGGSGGSAGGGGSNVSFTTLAVGAFNCAATQATLDGTGVVTMGAYPRARMNNTLAIGGSNSDSSIGGSQALLCCLGVHTSNATPANLTTDGAAVSTANQIGGGNASSSIEVVTGIVIASSGSGVNTASWKFEGQSKYVAGVYTLIYSLVTPLNIDAALVGATITMGVNTANRQITIIATGLAATVIRWTGAALVAERAG